MILTESGRRGRGSHGSVSQIPVNNIRPVVIENTLDLLEADEVLKATKAAAS